MRAENGAVPQGAEQLHRPAASSALTWASGVLVAVAAVNALRSDTKNEAAKDAAKDLEEELKIHDQDASTQSIQDAKENEPEEEEALEPPADDEEASEPPADDEEASEPPADDEEASEPPADDEEASEPPADDEEASEPPSDEPAEGNDAEPSEELLEEGEALVEEGANKRPKWDYEPTEGDYSAVFLDEESMEKLRKRFPPLFKENQAYDHVTVIFEPTKDQVLEHDDLLTEDYKVHVIGYAQDEHCQTVLVELSSPHLRSQNKYAHITLSYKGGEPYEARYSNVLLNRIATDEEAKKSLYLLKNVDEQNLYWNGQLDTAGTYEAVRASYQNVEEEEITLNGTYCLKSTFDKETRSCSYKRENECGFCKFMKAGPCRQEFMAWEKCVGDSKDDDDKDAFINRCAPQTIVLKNCVDTHPEYYFMLDNDEPTEVTVEGSAEPIAADEEPVSAEKNE